ncbi:MAG: Fic family protein [Armatimonadetes bacterium]|nr:Fic family protein [Armatimonadota bacterium]
MVFDSLKPYNDLPELPPRQDLETKVVLKKTVSAGRALAELKGLGETIPDQGVLINSIVLQEAKASSEIENVVTTNDALFRALASASSVNVDPATKEVLRYREALWTGFQDLVRRDLLTTNAFVEIANTIKKNQSDVRNIAGTVLSNPATGDVIYTPPEGEDIIRRKLKNLESYIHAPDGVDALVKMAVIHYQFEAIHPFSDGNGRTGRIINILYLVQQGLLDVPVLYLSRFIIENKSEYYRRLREVTEQQAWEPWILYMLDAVEETAIFTRKRMIDIRDMLNWTIEFVRLQLPKVYSKELVELLFKQPYTKGQLLVDANLAKRQTAAIYLRELERVGVLRGLKLGKEKIYLNVRLFDLLSK